MRAGADEIDALFVGQAVDKQPIVADVAFAAPGLSRALVREVAIQCVIEMSTVERPVLLETFHYETQPRYIAFAMTKSASEIFTECTRRSDRTAVRSAGFRHSFASLLSALGSASFLCVREQAIDGG
jgi:hypothetical protein